MVAPTMGRLGLETCTTVHRRRDAGELAGTRCGKRHGGYLRGGDEQTPICDATSNSGEARAISGFLHDGERTGQMRRGHHRGRRTGRRGRGCLGKGVSFFCTDRDGFYLSHHTWGKQEEMEAAVEDDG
jgi:hypothetical protein